MFDTPGFKENGAMDQEEAQVVDDKNTKGRAGGTEGQGGEGA